MTPGNSAGSRRHFLKEWFQRSLRKSCRSDETKLALKRDAPEFRQASATGHTQSLDKLSSRPTWHQCFYGAVWSCLRLVDPRDPGSSWTWSYHTVALLNRGKPSVSRAGASSNV